MLSRRSHLTHSAYFTLFLSMLFSFMCGTITVIYILSLHDALPIYDNPNALRDYFRDIGRMVLATLGSKNHTTNITKIVTQSIGIIIKIGRASCRERV